MSAAMGPDEGVFRAHIEKGPFLSGVDRERWRLIAIDWPYVLIAVAAAPRANGPAEYAFRFRCDDYPQTAPTAQPWNSERGGPLEPRLWPGGQPRVTLAFNPSWHGGQCLYLPCDRISMQGHDGWRTQHPGMLWSPNGDITQYLRIIHDLLNSSAYTGPRGA